MDLNPKKFDKEKDNLFFDFFSIYAKNFLKQKPLQKTHWLLYLNQFLCV